MRMSDWSSDVCSSELVPVGAGTDATRVASYDPWVSLYWLTTGKTLGGMPLYGEENVLGRLPRARVRGLHPRRRLLVVVEVRRRAEAGRVLLPVEADVRFVLLDVRVAPRLALTGHGWPLRRLTSPGTRWLRSRSRSGHRRA